MLLKVKNQQHTNRPAENIHPHEGGGVGESFARPSRRGSGELSPGWNKGWLPGGVRLFVVHLC